MCIIIFMMQLFEYNSVSKNNFLSLMKTYEVNYKDFIKLVNVEIINSDNLNKNYISKSSVSKKNYHYKFSPYLITQQQFDFRTIFYLTSFY